MLSKKEFFRLSKSMYATNFNENMIILDTTEDRYLILNEESSKTIKKLLTSTKLRFSKIEQDTIKELIRFKLITRFNKFVPSSNCYFYEEKKMGVVNLDWRMIYGNLNRKVPLRLFIEAYATLIHVYLINKKKKLWGIINKINNYSKKIHFKKESTKLLNELCIALDKACFLFPQQTKCLVWSATLTFMLLRRGIKADFRIGVQNYPFLAHAWVEINGLVIADDKNLSDDLSVIFSSLR